MKTRAIIGHVLFWCIIMLTYAFSEWGYRNNFFEAILFELLFLPVRLMAVYINWFILIPWLLYKNRVFRYLLLLFLLLLILSIAQRYFVLYWAYPTFFPAWMTTVPEPLVLFRIVQTMVIIASPVAFSIGIKLFFDWYKQKNKATQLEIEKREAELKYLKAQINPHFLFNTLNNLYGLSIEQSKKVPKLILKLSDFLSYSLYESENGKTTVEKEINLARDYIDLEICRYEDRILVNWDIDKIIFDVKISSLLFMPLIENAFKHGVREEIGQAIISLRLVKENDWLVFEVKNSYPDVEQSIKPSGIGLANLRRRLQLLYPNGHILDTNKKNGQYIATLKLKNNE